MVQTKPNPLEVERRRRGSLQEDIARGTEPKSATHRYADATSSGVSGKGARAPKIDTAALTGVRGLAALHVALGHIFGLSTLRQDLIGGAAMPFFFLLSGFVMTLGYGQTVYASAGCCGQPGEEDLAKKLMDKGKFWRNRFARLAPVYYFTNIGMSSMVFEMGGVGLNGTHQGVVGAILQGVCTLLGINSWLFPFIDVGMPLNGVTWTITTMSFFYLMFPWMLPPMQRLTPTQRRRGIVVCYWVQLMTYSALVNLYEFVVPVAQFIPAVDETGLQLGSWRAGLDYDFSPMYSYWVARAWPMTRVLVFAMGCLAALNRVEANNRQAELDEEDAPRSHVAADGTRTESNLEQDDPLLLPQDDTAASSSDRRSSAGGAGGELSGPTNAGYLECCSCCGREHGWLKPYWLLGLPAVITNRQDGGLQAAEIQRQWASVADWSALIYLVVITGVVLVERFVMPIGGRIWLECVAPAWQLELIVALTYDGRRSITARFCNWAPVR